MMKQRNPFVQHIVKKKQGAHGKSKKAMRKQEKQKLKKTKGLDKETNHA